MKRYLKRAPFKSVFVLSQRAFVRGRYSTLFYYSVASEQCCCSSINSRVIHLRGSRHITFRSRILHFNCNSCNINNLRCSLIVLYTFRLLIKSLMKNVHQSQRTTSVISVCQIHIKSTFYIVCCYVNILDWIW